MNTLRPQIRRDFLPLCQKTLDSPYFLALLAGLWPIAFFTSNNWFMFEPSRIPFIVGTVHFHHLAHPEPLLSCALPVMEKGV